MIDEKQQHPQWDHMKQKDSNERQVIASRSERNQQKRKRVRQRGNERQAAHLGPNPSAADLVADCACASVAHGCRDSRSNRRIRLCRRRSAN